MLTPEQLLASVAQSKKYAFLDEGLLLRICREEAGKFKKDKDYEKAVKNRLHQVFGAYFADDGHKAASLLLDRVAAGEMPLADAAQKVMLLHASTKERLPLYPALFAWLAQSGCAMERVLDIGCGFNPFCLALPNAPQVKAYTALDIDKRTALLNNRLFALLGLPPLAATLDAVLSTPTQTADLALVFKLLPVLEIQQKGRGFALLAQLPAQTAVVSFPLSSLGGKKKGMEETYTRLFEEHEGESWRILDKQKLGNELFYMIRKGEHKEEKV